MIGTSFKKKVSPPVGYTPPRARKKFRQGEISAPEALYEAQDTDAVLVLVAFANTTQIQESKFKIQHLKTI